MSLQKRSAAADILRCLAFFFVVSVHFLLHNGFYSQTVEGKRMFVMVMMRALFIICVPLFIMLSGYLLRKKTLSRQYYTRIGKILLTYVLCSLVCMAYSMIFLHKPLTIGDIFLKLLNFTGAQYAWYIEMYLGLFLLIPFLNIVYNHLPSQKWKAVLILSFVILTSLPSVLNVYNLTDPSWWALPSASKEYNKLVPAWWTGMYPITYYFIGCYISEYGLKLKTSWNALLVVVCTLVSGIYSYWRSHGSVFVSGVWCGYASLFNVVLTTLVFTLFINLNYDKFPPILTRFFQNISGLCLGGYLISWVFDTIFYPMLLEKVPVVQQRVEYYFLIVPAVTILSLLATYVISKLQWLLETFGALCARRLGRTS